MYPKGLKTNIILNLLLILAAAMLLIDLVMLGSARQELLRARLETGNSLLAATGPILIKGQSEQGLSSSQLSVLMNEASANCITAINNVGANVFSYGSDCASIENLQGDVEQALESGESSSSFEGITKGVFWPDRKNILISRPIFNDKEIDGAVAVALDMGVIYQSLRNSQRIFFVYFLVNLLLFVMFGFYQLYRRLLKPINQLVDTAEEFRDENDFTFLPETRSGEFNRLSHTLNKMLARINRDKSKLQETILDLEATNMKLINTQQEVIRAEKLASVGRLSAGVAHEIGNPIGIVIGYLDLLKKASITKEQKKDFISRAEKEVSRINTIIRQLLDFARQPLDEPQSEISIHETINEVVEICSVQPMMARIKVAIETTAAENLVVGTNGQLKQIFLNLLINAADAINSTNNDCDEGKIIIRTIVLDHADAEDRGGYIQIQFIDNGSGIETDNLGNIFDPFYTTKEPGKGTGLGLSICFTLIESMGGNIKAESNQQGTTITVILPLSHNHSNVKDK